MRLDLIAQLLEDADLGVMGESIFIHRMGPDCKRGIMLRTPLDGVRIDPNLPQYYKTSLQVIVRAVDQIDGDQLMELVREELTMYNHKFFAIDNVTLLMKINHLIPRTLPRVYPRLDGQGIEWSMDFNANYVMPFYAPGG